MGLGWKDWGGGVGEAYDLGHEKTVCSENMHRRRTHTSVGYVL